MFSLTAIAVRISGVFATATDKMTDDDGQTLAEYGLIMAVIAVAVISAAAVVFRGAIITAFKGGTKCLSGSC